MKHGSRSLALALVGIAVLLGCSTTLPTPEPRSIIVYSGTRIQADADRMAEVEAWLLPEQERIDLDPSFLIRITAAPEPRYPWDTIEIVADTVDLTLNVVGADAETPYSIYGYLRLMDDWGTLEEVLPESLGQSGYGVERAILTRLAEVWLLGRSVFDTQPYGPLDELVYANEFGFLDEFAFVTQGERFASAADEYWSANPGREAEFRSWFRETFGADGPRFVPPPDEALENDD